MFERAVVVELKKLPMESAMMATSTCLRMSFSPSMCETLSVTNVISTSP